MSVQRIDSADGRTRGYQARAHVGPGWRLTQFFADQACGGQHRAKAAAEAVEPKLKRKALRLRREATR